MRFFIALSLLYFYGFPKLLQAHLITPSAMVELESLKQRAEEDSPSAKIIISLYKEAAGGSFAAQNSMGVWYSRAQTNYEEARHWFEKSARSGYAVAQYNLGLIYFYGRGGEKDNKKAFFWFKLAGDQGHLQAQYNAGSMLYNGQGVKKNYKKALNRLIDAAGRGHVMAQYNAGILLYRGEGVKANHKEAYRWLKMAANKNQALAQFQLGLMYQNGEGKEKDFVKAYVWLVSAKRNWTNHFLKTGSSNSAKLIKEAEQTIEELSQAMSPAQIKKAQALLESG